MPGRIATVCAALLLAVLSPSARVSAQAIDLDGATRISIETPMAELAWTQWIQQSANMPDTDADETRLSIGPRANLGLGASWVSRDWAFGLRAAAARDTRTMPDHETESWALQLSPEAIMLMGRGWLRPFAGVFGTIGVARTDVRRRHGGVLGSDSGLLYGINRDLPAVVSLDETRLNLGGGARGGVHLFVSDTLSFDVGAQLGYVRSVMLSEDEWLKRRNLETVSIALFIGLSGWLR